MNIPEQAKLADAMNMVGAKGWELVSVTELSTDPEVTKASYYFKRRK